MGCAEGSFLNLIKNNNKVIDSKIINLMLFQMLVAFRYLEKERVAHLDVKPENILWIWEKENYHFWLADFGLSATFDKNYGQRGTRIFMAPEVYHETGYGYFKADVWSLFATYIYARTDISKFGKSEPKSYSDGTLPDVERIQTF